MCPTTRAPLRALIPRHPPPMIPQVRMKGVVPVTDAGGGAIRGDVGGKGGGPADLERDAAVTGPRLRTRLLQALPPTLSQTLLQIMLPGMSRVNLLPELSCAPIMKMIFGLSLVAPVKQWYICYE